MLKLLIVKTSSLGDVIHNLPIVTDIQAQHPDIEIDWVVEKMFADIPRLHPGVNQVIPVAIRQWRKAPFAKATWQAISETKAALQSKQYDLVLDTQGLLKSGLLTKLSHGKKHGYDRHSIREPLASCFYDIRHVVSKNQHAVARNRALAASAFGYSSPAQLPEYGIQARAPLPAALTQPYVVALHGTSRDRKLWEIPRWIELGRALETRQLPLVLPWSNEAELQRAQLIAKNLQHATILPKLSIAQLATVISHAQAAIGVDTGLSHLAVALSIPTIALYTDTDPALTGVCAGAFAPAINLGNTQQSPPVAQVLDAFDQL